MAPQPAAHCSLQGLPIRRKRGHRQARVPPQYHDVGPRHLHTLSVVGGRGPQRSCGRLRPVLMTRQTAPIPSGELGRWTTPPAHSSKQLEGLALRAVRVTRRLVRVLVQTTPPCLSWLSFHRPIGDDRHESAAIGGDNQSANRCRSLLLTQQACPQRRFCCRRSPPQLRPARSPNPTSGAGPVFNVVRTLRNGGMADSRFGRDVRSCPWCAPPARHRLSCAGLDRELAGSRIGWVRRADRVRAAGRRVRVAALVVATDAARSSCHAGAQHPLRDLLRARVRAPGLPPPDLSRAGPRCALRGEVGCINGGSGGRRSQSTFDGRPRWALSFGGVPRQERAWAGLGVPPASRASGAERGMLCACACGLPRIPADWFGRGGEKAAAAQNGPPPRECGQPVSRDPHCQHPG